MQRATVWAGLLVLALLLIVVGWRGRLGSLIGAVVTPAQLIDSPTS